MYVKSTELVFVEEHTRKKALTTNKNVHNENINLQIVIGIRKIRGKHISISVGEIYRQKSNNKGKVRFLEIRRVLLSF